MKICSKQLDNFKKTLHMNWIRTSISTDLYIRKVLLEFINRSRTTLPKFLKSNKLQIMTEGVHFATSFKMKKRRWRQSSEDPKRKSVSLSSRKILSTRVTSLWSHENMFRTLDMLKLMRNCPNGSRK